MSSISTHVLDTTLGKPAAGVAVSLQLIGPAGEVNQLVEATTDSDGRTGVLLPEGELKPGTYRLTFHTAPYHVAAGQEFFCPSVGVTFCVDDVAQHYHVPLLLSPFGYSTYRGS